MKTNKGFIFFLAMITGATVAIGFWPVAQHVMLISRVVFLPSGNPELQVVETLAGTVICSIFFVGGAAISTVLQNCQHGETKSEKSTVSLLVQAIIFAWCGLIGTKTFKSELVSLIGYVVLFAFLLGMQNAMILSLWSEECGSTLSSGIVTNLGIELGNAIYPTQINQGLDKKPYFGSLSRLRLLMLIVGLFMCGVLIGTVGFTYLGGNSCFILATTLLLFPAVSMTRKLV